MIKGGNRLLVAFVTLAMLVFVVAAETQGPAATGQKLERKPPHVSDDDFKGNPETEKVINDGEHNEYVNPKWVDTEKKKRKQAAIATGQPTAWIVKSWWHRLNFDGEGKHVGDYVGDMTRPFDVAKSHVVHYNSVATHYGFVLAGPGAKTDVFGAATLANSMLPGTTTDGEEMLSQVVRRGKDQKFIDGGIENVDSGEWEFYYDAALKLKAGVNWEKSWHQKKPTADAYAYGRLRVFVNGGIEAVDDGEIRRTNKEDVDFGIVDVKTQYGVSEECGWYHKAGNMVDHDFSDLEPGDESLVSCYDVVQVSGKAKTSNLESSFAYSSYCNILAQATGAGNGYGGATSRARVTHSRIKRVENDTYTKDRADLSDEDKEKFAESTYWDVTLKAFEWRGGKRVRLEEWDKRDLEN